MKYTLKPEMKFKLQCQIVLENMINYNETYPVTLDATEYQNMLSPLLEDMYVKELVVIEGINYVPTPKGRQALVKYLNKYHEFLAIYDVFNAVDLDAKEANNDMFALGKYYDFETDEEYDTYANSDKFWDLRWQMLEYKKLDPTEYVFMSYINEKKIDLEADGWEFELMSTGIFDDMMDFLNNINRLDAADVEEAFPLIIKAGVDLLKEEKAEQTRLEAEEAEEARQTAQEDLEDEYEDEYEDEPQTEVVTYVEYVEEPIFGYDYYDSYYDPFYVSPYFYDDGWY